MNGTNTGPACRIDASKERLITGLPTDMYSARDLGGIWGVNGHYSKVLAEHLSEADVELVDTATPDEGFPDTVAHIKSRFEDYLSHAPAVDVSVLFDVILHQTCPVHFLKQVTDTTEHRILIAQPLLAEANPVCMNLQFLSDPEWRHYQLDSLDRWSRLNGRPSLWTTGAWAWGQSLTWLTYTLKGFGWVVEPDSIMARQDPSITYFYHWYATFKPRDER
mgnify:CR=1 FL=1